MVLRWAVILPGGLLGNREYTFCLTLARYSKLADFGKELLNKKSLAEGLPLISKYAKEVIGADRSCFVHTGILMFASTSVIASGALVNMPETPMRGSSSSCR